MGNRIKNIIKTLLHSTGWEMTSYHQGYRVRYHPLEGKQLSPLQFAVPAILLNQKDFFFIQVGANDGILFDPLRPLILKYHLRGLLIEPLPDMFERLKKNYASEKQLVFLNTAVAKQSDEVSLFRFRSDAPVDRYIHGLATFDEKSVRSLARDLRLESWVEEVRIMGTTFSEMISKHSIEKISLLQIDTEGFDFEVIRMALECGKCPELINYEHSHLSPQDRLESCRLLDKYGYSFIHGNSDTLAVLQDDLR